VRLRVDHGKGAPRYSPLIGRREKEQACAAASLFSHTPLCRDRRINGLVPLRDRRADLNHTGLQPLRYSRSRSTDSSPSLTSAALTST